MTKTRTSMLDKIPTRNFDLAKKDLMRVSLFEMNAIAPDPDQPRKRFDNESLEELSNSIRKHGLLQPILLKKNTDGKGYVIIAGERRWRASKLAKREKIEGILTNGNSAEIALIENVQRENLTPIEEAFAYKRLMDQREISQGELAQIVGKKRNTVNEVLRITTLPDDILAEMEDYPHITKSQLIIISKEVIENKRTRLWAAAKQGRLTVRDTKADRAETKRQSDLTPAERGVKAIDQAVQRLEKIKDFSDEQIVSLRKIRTLFSKVIKENSGGGGRPTPP
jgi:ParB family chromosome partitioning protein